MVYIRSSRRYLLLGCVLYIAAAVALHIFIGDVQIVWTGIGTGTVLLGVAAIITAWIKLREYMAKTDRLERQVNGGLAAAAKTHLQDNELFEALITRQDQHEATIATLVEERDDCTGALTELRLWVMDRLDQTGNGRTHGRTD